jgi:Protein of unknown function (DUF1997)
MDIRFTSSQAVELVVPDYPIHIANYLRQPQRVVKALAASSQIDPLSEDLYRLSMRPLKFMSLSLQPVVDMRVWADSDAIIQVQSVNCNLRGMEYVNDKFQLILKGELYPTQVHGATYLKGLANLAVEVELPPPFNLTPRPILETAGNGLLVSVLSTIKHRLMNQLIADYKAWAIAQANLAKPSSETLLEQL